MTKIEVDPLDLPQSIGPYRVDEVLGAGGMGIVYGGFDPKLQRPVAIKQIHPTRWRHHRARRRFQREARIVSSLQSPFLVQLFDVAEGDDGSIALVMEKLHGITLKQYLERGPIPRDLALRFLQEITEALRALHQRRIVHRDLKPDNIMIVQERIKVLDLGLAKTAAGAESMDSTVSDEGSVVGTYRFMAPEQHLGMEIDERADLFALGAIAYELLSGQYPFEGKNRDEIVYSICHDRPPSLAKLVPGLPEGLMAWVTRLLEKNPTSRPKHAGRALAELQEAIRAPQSQQQPKLDDNDTELSRETPSAGPNVSSSSSIRSLAQTTLQKARKHPGRSVSFFALASVLVAWLFAGVSSTPERLSLLVLEPTNSSRQERLAWFGPAIADLLALELAGTKQLQPLERGWVRDTAFVLGIDAAAQPEKLAEAVGADAVLTGHYLPLDEEAAAIDLQLSYRLFGHPSPLWSAHQPASRTTLRKTVRQLSSSLKRQIGWSSAIPGQARAQLATFPTSDQAMELYSKARVHLQRLEASRGRELLEEARSLAPTSYLVLSSLAEAYRLEGRVGPAQETAIEAWRHAARPWERLSAQARSSELAEDWQEASLKLEQLFDLAPSDLGTGIRFGEALRRAGRTDRALSLVDDLESLARGRVDPRVPLLRGRILHDASRYQEQLESADSALERASRLTAPILEARALLIRSAAEAALGSHEAALASATRAQKLYAENQDDLGSLRSLERLANDYSDRGELLAAELLYKSVIQSYEGLGYPLRWRAVYNLAATLARAGLHSEADAWLSSLPADLKIENPIHAASFLFRQGNALLTAGSLTSARHTYGKALAIGNTENHAYVRALAISNLAEISLLEGQLEAARDGFEEGRVLKHLKAKPVAYETAYLGRIAALGGAYHLAETLLERATRLADEDGSLADRSQAQLFLAELRLWQGLPMQSKQLAAEVLGSVKNESLSQAALASAILARSQMALGESTEARRTLEPALGSLSDGDIVTAIQVKIAAARIEGELGNTESAISQLEALIDRASSLNLAQLALEARFALAGLHFRSGDPRQMEEIRDDAERLGFGAIESRASGTLAEGG